MSITRNVQVGTRAVAVIFKERRLVTNPEAPRNERRENVVECRIRQAFAYPALYVVQRGEGFIAGPGGSASSVSAETPELAFEAAVEKFWS